MVKVSYICILITLLVTASAVYSAPPHPKLLFRDFDGSFEPMMSTASMDMAQYADPDIPRKGYNPQPDGIEYILAIRIDFSDKPGRKPASVFNDAIFGTKDTSMKLYFEEVSYNQMHISPGYLGGVVPDGRDWYRAREPMSYYGEGTIMTERYRQLTEEACIAADAEVDFSKYDRDGDGYLDHLMVIHAGDDEASTGFYDDIWSAVVDTIPGTYDGVKIASAMIVAEDPSSNVINIGIYCHEFLHEFGAPDLYAWDYPVGHWCLMGMFGPYQNDGQHPSHVCGYLKWDLDAQLSNGIQGWLKPDTLAFSGIYSIDSFELNYGNRLYKVDIPGKFGKEYFLIENRNKLSSAIYDTYLPESGIVIWHIDENQPRSLSYPHRVWVEDPTDPDRRNLREATEGAAFSADDGQITFTPSTIPSTNANDGTYSGIIISGIGEEGLSMPFELFFGDTYEPNDNIADAFGMIEYGKQYISFIKDKYDIDYYKFRTDADSMVIVYLDDIPADSDYGLHVYDSQINLIAVSDEQRESSKRISFKAKKGNIYYVSVSSNFGFSPDQPYTLAIDSAPLDLAPRMIAVSKVYPNPGPDGKGRVWFEYKLLDLVNEITLEIYTITGVLIHAQTVQAFDRTGKLFWDTRNSDDGIRIASGLYIYVLRTELDGKTDAKSGKIALIY